MEWIIEEASLRAASHSFLEDDGFAIVSGCRELGKDNLSGSRSRAGQKVAVRAPQRIIFNDPATLLWHDVPHVRLAQIRELGIMPKQKAFVARSKEEVQGKIAEWVAADPSILILRKTFAPKATFVDAQQPGEKLPNGSGDWEATVEYEELSPDAQRVTGRPLG
jgi:hypothetical protein